MLITSMQGRDGEGNDEMDCLYPHFMHKRCLVIFEEICRSVFSRLFENFIFRFIVSENLLLNFIVNCMVCISDTTYISVFHLFRNFCFVDISEW